MLIGAEAVLTSCFNSVSVGPGKSIKVFMHVDTLSSSVFRKISSAAPLKPSHVRIFPYSGEAIHPLGKVSLICEGVSCFEKHYQIPTV